MALQWHWTVLYLIAIGTIQKYEIIWSNILIMICRSIFEDLYRIENTMFWHLNFFIDGFVYIKFYLCRSWYCFIWAWSECWFFTPALTGLTPVTPTSTDTTGTNTNGLAVADPVSIGSMWKEKKTFLFGECYNL